MAAWSSFALVAKASVGTPGVSIHHTRHARHRPIARAL